MKTLNITLENELEQRLTALAQLEHRSEVEIILDALEAYTTPNIPDWVGIGASDAALSKKDEEILRTGWR